MRGPRSAPENAAAERRDLLQRIRDIGSQVREAMRAAFERYVDTESARRKRPHQESAVGHGGFRILAVEEHLLGRYERGCR